MILKFRHVLAALVLHAALISLLVFGVQCSSKPVRPPVIQGVILDKSRQQVAAEKRQQQLRQEQERKAEQQRREQEEQARQRQEAEQQKQREAEAERQRQAEADRQKRLAEQKKKDEEAQRQKQAAAQKKAEEEARRKQEQEAQKEKQAEAAREIQEKARMEEQMRQEALQREAAQEDAARAASEREQKTAAWADQLERHIQKYWIRPASAGGDFQCTVDVKLLPDGSVSYAKIDKSCGSATLDRSVESAVYRASPLPKPDDPSVFDRELVITFEPGPQ